MANGLLAREAKIKQAWLEAGEKTGFQMACDFISIALNDPDCMGAKGVMSGERISAVMEYAIKLQDEYHKAFEPRDVEADVWQDRLDKRQAKIFKGKAVAFSERYPYLKGQKY